MTSLASPRTVGAAQPADWMAAAPLAASAWRGTLRAMDTIRIVDVVDGGSFGLLPPCADPAFDHRTCDYWEDRDRGSKAHRPAWLQVAEAEAGDAPVPGGASARRAPANPFAPAADERPANPFAPASKRSPGANPFALDPDDAADPNPFAPPRPQRPGVPAGSPRKLGLLGRGLAVFGSYAKVLLVDDGLGERPVAYAQFGPLSAYPRALRLRELYPQLPDTPLPAVITCIATTVQARERRLALHLVEAVCGDLAGRGFFAVEAYPEANERPDATSAATPAFWVRAGFRVAVDDDRFPVVRREL